MTKQDAMQRMLLAIETGDSELLYELSDACCGIAFMHGGCNTDEGRAWQSIMQAAADAAQQIEG